MVHLIAPLFLSYRNAKELAEKSKQTLAESGMFKEPIVTEIRPAAPFMRLKNTINISIKNPEKYATEQKESGRADFIKENWQKKNRVGD